MLRQLHPAEQALRQAKAFMTLTNVQQNYEHSIALASHSHLQLHVSQFLHQLLQLKLFKHRPRTPMKALQVSRNV
jgi:hypothetical protein